MVIRKVELETVCGITSKLPENPYAEIAFAGKSNVGKSSLINALMNRKALARTSAQPGKTQTINFYNVNECMYLVDLPGYGYANANVEIKAQWGRMIENYLHTSKQLAAVFLLIDIRHDPSENDKLMYDWILSQGYAPIIIATKADKINRSQLAAHVEAIHQGLDPEAELTILPFSALNKQGRDEIWDVMDEILGIEKERATIKQNGKTKSSDKTAASGNALLMNESVKSAAIASEKMVTDDLKTQASDDENSPARKPRWKSTGKSVAKKQQKIHAKREEKKSAGNKKSEGNKKTAGNKKKGKK